MANFTVKLCYPNWLKIAGIVCHVVSYSSRTERLLTLQSCSKLDCRQLQWLRWKRRMATELTRPQSSWLSCLRSYACTQKTFQPSPNTIDELKSCSPHGTICHRTLSTRPYWTSSKNFEFVWKLGPDTLNTSWDKVFSQSFQLVASDVFDVCDFNASIRMKIVILIVNVLHGSVVA